MKTELKKLDVDCGRRHVRVTWLKADMFRLQIAVNGRFEDSGLNRYGFIAPPNVPRPRVRCRRTPAGMVMESSALRITLRGRDGLLQVFDRRRRREILRQTAAVFEDTHAGARFRAAADEDWVGFGDQTRERLYHRGTVADLWVRNVKSYVPVPFFMSTRGVGILVNTTHHLVCDMCRSRRNEYAWTDRRGTIDFYVLAAPDFAGLIEAYTELAGKPRLPPAWSFGLWYLCRTQANAYEAVNDACNFRRENIPCDVLGLEPGWMEQFYDYSLDKRWSRERFPIPAYAPRGPNNFINALKRMGFKLELWLCNNYDLTWEEERRTRRTVAVTGDLGAAGNYRPGHEVDEHFSGRDMLDKITRPETPWFDHLKSFVDQGADFFKQDGALQVVEHPDRLAGNGMHDAELHNLYPLLYSRQMYEGFAAHTGRRPVVFTVSGWTGFQAWCGTWAGDTGGGLDTIGGLLNQALVGHAWVTNDMEVHTPEGIHFGYLQPWSQINSWTYFRMPWVQGQVLLDMHRAYAQLRARLVPYLYSWAYRATLDGMPLMRPLTLVYPADRRCRTIMHQYLLGRDLMVVTFKKQAYFPAGRWKDFWTGAVMPAGRSGRIAWPADRGGGLYVREGGIVPLGPLMQYRGEKPVDAVELYLFPGRDRSEFGFYDDDGVSFDHLRGKFALTPVAAQAAAGRVKISVGRPAGGYARRIGRRRWSFAVALDFLPRRVMLNGRRLAGDAWEYDARRGEIRIRAQAGPLELVIARDFV